MKGLMKLSWFISALAVAFFFATIAAADSDLPEPCQGVDDSPQFIALRQWYSAHDVKFPHLCVGKTKDKGLGIFATQTIEPKQTLFISNYSLLFGVHNIQPPELSSAIDKFKEEFKLNDNEILVIYLIASLRNGSSMWQPWFDTLPKAKDLTNSFLWSKSELESLEAPSSSRETHWAVHYEIQQSNQRIAIALNYLAGNHSNYRNALNVPVDELTWAHAIIFSRSLDMQVMGKPSRVAPPYFDFFNHKMNVPTNYALNDGNGSMVNGSISLNLNISIKAGDEIQFEWASWSSRHNGMNLALAGVVVPSSLAHSYELNASIATTDYKYDVKMKALQAAGLTDRGALNISLKNPLSPNLIKHFCVLSADKNGGYSDKDIHDMAFGRFAFTPAQVKNVYSNLITGCRNVLHAFHSAYSKDEKEFIQDVTLSRRKRLAAQMRMEDKILMEAAIKAAKKAMEKLMVRRLHVICLQVLETFSLHRMTRTNECSPRCRTDHTQSAICDQVQQYMPAAHVLIKLYFLVAALRSQPSAPFINHRRRLSACASGRQRAPAESQCDAA